MYASSIALCNKGESVTVPSTENETPELSAKFSPISNTGNSYVSTPSLNVNVRTGFTSPIILYPSSSSSAYALEVAKETTVNSATILKIAMFFALL